MIQIVFGLIFKIVFMLAVGFFLKKRGILTLDDKSSMTKVLMSCVVYFMIIMTSQTELSQEAARAIGITALVAAGMYIVFIPLCIFIAKHLNISDSKQRIFVCTSVFCNVTFMGYPICQELFGNVGLLCAIIFSMVYNLIFYTWGYAYIGRTDEMNIKSIFTNKIAITCVIAVSMYFFQIKIPEPFAGTFNAIGSMTLPMSMLITGCGLADADLMEIIKNKQIYISTFLRMIVMPAAVYTVMKILGFSGLVLEASVIMAALPTGTMTGIVAAQYGTEPEYAAQGMLQTMIVMLVTLPVWIILIQL